MQLYYRRSSNIKTNHHFFSMLQVSQSRENHAKARAAQIVSPIKSNYATRSRRYLVIVVMRFLRVTEIKNRNNTLGDSRCAR